MVNAPTSQVWHTLTTPELMKKWMMPDLEINIITDWKVGSPIVIRGTVNEKEFENREGFCNLNLKRFFNIVI